MNQMDSYLKYKYYKIEDSYGAYIGNCRIYSWMPLGKTSRIHSTSSEGFVRVGVEEMLNPTHDTKIYKEIDWASWVNHYSQPHSTVRNLYASSKYFIRHQFGKCL